MNMLSASIAGQEISLDPLLQKDSYRNYHKNSDGTTTLLSESKRLPQNTFINAPLSFNQVSTQSGTRYSNVFNPIVKLGLEDQIISPRDGSRSITEEVFIDGIYDFLLRNEFFVKLALVFISIFSFSLFLTHSLKLSLITGIFFSFSSIMGSFIRRK